MRLQQEAGCLATSRQVEFPDAELLKQRSQTGNTKRKAGRVEVVFARHLTSSHALSAWNRPRRRAQSAQLAQ
ncbi:hypothetical protein RvY_01474 [Ramazzottius varieornatus]|uniref:Uncharacterized protein n=1 Tax=Ramazzottius varieornatus TaxID=947166 RepID=A0A1D1UGF6_RAMVA|nr:hypothetical protein RvY_01474 [Ramazzottius varieornatus]